MVGEAVPACAAVGASPLGFQVKLGLVFVVSIFLPVSMLLKLLTFPPRLLVLVGMLLLQTVLRAEFWSAIIAMQAYWPCQ